MEILNLQVPYLNVTIHQILLAIFAFAVGYIIVSILMDLFKRSLMRTRLPKMMVEFLVKFTKIIGIVLVVLAILPIVGINVNSIVLGLSAVIGLILGFGLQDTMTNIFSGLWLAMLKPFDIGDYIEINGIEGTLKSVGIMSTRITTFDNKEVMIPNKLIWGSPIINHTKLNKRRILLTVGVSYNTKLDKAISIANKIMKSKKEILDEPKPEVVVSELADSSINLQLRAWVKTEDYWKIKSELAKEVVKEFKKNKIEIPYPQLDVHIKKK